MQRKPKELGKNFMDYLEKNREKDDRGFMADLRQAFSHRNQFRTWPHIAPFCDLRNERMRIIYQTVAGAYAHHPLNTDKGNMGNALQQLAMGDGRGKEGLKTFDGRFRRYLTCDNAEELCIHIAGVFRPLAKSGIPVNYLQLFTDLWYWGEITRIEWAYAYWSVTGGKS